MSIKCHFRTFEPSLNGKLLEIKYKIEKWKNVVYEKADYKLESQPFSHLVERIKSSFSDSIECSFSFVNNKKKEHLL